MRTQLVTPEQLESELLFPSENGGFRSEHLLRKPFAAVGKLLHLPLRFTPHGLRRTFNDLMRIAKVEAVVTKSISGHLTDRMREHYSTVSTIEQRESMGQVLRLVRPEPVPGGGAPTPPSGAPREEGAA